MTFSLFFFLLLLFFSSLSSYSFTYIIKLIGISILVMMINHARLQRHERWGGGGERKLVGLIVWLCEYVVIG